MPSPPTAAQRTSVRGPALVGLAGCLLIVVFSTAVGWIGPFSNLRTSPLLSWGRDNPVVTVWCSFGVITGGVLLTVAWLVLGARARRLADPAAGVRALVRTGALWAAPLLLSIPLYSRDIFAYVGQGRLMMMGRNPYDSAVGEIGGWYGIGVDPMWSDTRTPYGPVVVALEELIVRVSGSSPVVAVALLRLVAAGCFAAIVYCGHRLATRNAGDARTFHILVTASPLSLAIYVVSGHNDAIMLALILAGVLAVQGRRPWLSLLLVTAAIGVKPIAVIALPVIGLIWAGQDRTWPRVLRYWAICAAGAAGLLAGLGALLGVGLGWIGALSTPGSVRHWYAPARWVDGAVVKLTELFGGSEDAGETIAKVLLLGVMGLLVAWIMLTPRISSDLARLSWAFAAVVGTSPFIHPWYAAWVLTMFAITGIAPGLPMRLATGATTFLCWIFVFDKTDSPTSIAGSSWPKVVHDVLAGIAFVALALCALATSDVPVRRRTTPAVPPHPAGKSGSDGS